MRDTLKLLFKTDDELVKLARSRETPGNKLVKVYRMGNSNVKEAVASNPNTPAEALAKELIKAIIAKKKDVRQSAVRAMGRIPKRPKKRYEALRLELASELTGILSTCDWYVSIDVVLALGILGDRLATDTICGLIDTALKGMDTFGGRSSWVDLEEGQTVHKSLVMTTDTDDTPRHPEEVYFSFVSCAVRALGNIEDLDAVDTLKSIAKIKSGMYGSSLKSDARAALKKSRKSEQGKQPS